MCKKLFFFLIATLLISCDHFDSKLKLTNRSHRTVCYYESDDTIDINWLSNFIKPYTINSYGDSIVNRKIYLRPNESQNLSTPSEWKYTIDNNFKDSTIHIYIFDSVVVSQCQKGEQVSREKLYKRYDLKSKDLEKMNWNLIHDGK